VEPGTLITGRYRLDEVIASGGMGTVWRGFDTRLKRAVAVKVLKTGFESDAVARARFEHEAQSVASLRHTGIAALYDYSEMEDETGRSLSYLVMELIEGRSLTARLLEGPMEPAEAMRLCSQVAEALECAHEAGIIHRDVKPANVIIDRRGRAVLVDFGIALSAGRTAITETGMLLGTLYYASPEQLEGHELTYATDIYSLGAVAYECLAGNPPFTGGTAGTILNGHLNQPPPRLPERVPPGPAAVVLRALAKLPDQRWPSAAAFAEAADEAVADPQAAGSLPPHRPFHAPSPPATAFDAPTTQLRRPQRPGRRRRLALVLAAVAAVAVAAGALMFSTLLGMAEGDGGELGTFAALGSATSSADGTWGDSASASGSPSGTTSDEATDQGQGGSDTDTQEDADAGEDPTTVEETEEDPGTVDGGAAHLPDVWGWHYLDAWDELYHAGWENLELDTSAVDPDTGQTECSVLHTDPAGGASVHYDEHVVIVFLEFEDGNCG
jgi:serine/threonine protein kinase